MLELERDLYIDVCARACIYTPVPLVVQRIQVCACNKISKTWKDKLMGRLKRRLCFTLITMISSRNVDLINAGVNDGHGHLWVVRPCEQQWFDGTLDRPCDMHEWFKILLYLTLCTGQFSPFWRCRWRASENARQWCKDVLNILESKFICAALLSFILLWLTLALFH